MNKHFYRIIFNKARGMLMVVAEIVKSHQGEGRTTQKAKASLSHDKNITAALTPLCFLTYVALGLVSVVTSSYANTIIVDKNADKSQRPTLNNTANGVTQINIQEASKAGVSHNKFSQFDVSEKGVVLNNSAQLSNTELAGYIKGNDNLVRSGSAKVILNEINAKNASQLNGYIEVAGQKAQVVIANAAGITCNGCGFINADRATLTTGKPIMQNGQLTGYLVEQGNITINGKGMDSSRQNYTHLISRSVNINSSLWANDAQVIVGKNKVSYDLQTIEPLESDDDKPQLAIDVAGLGGMYAGNIKLVGTERGVGVYNAGSLGASAGSVTINTEGKIVNTGTIIAKTDAQLTAQSIDNQNQIASSNQLLHADKIDNSGEMSANSFKVKTTHLTNTGQGNIYATDLVIDADEMTNTGLVNADSLLLNAKQLNNIGTGRIYASDLVISSDELNNLADDNRAATIASTGRLAIASKTINNYEHSLIYSEGDMVIGGSLNDDLTVSGSATVINNHSATIESAKNVQLAVDELNNINDHIEIEVRDLEVETILEYQASKSPVRYSKDELTFFNSEVWHMRMPNGDYTDDYYEYQYERAVRESKITHSEPAKILAGNSLVINANHVLNDNSQLIAGSDLTVNADSFDTRSLEGKRYTVDNGIVTYFYRISQKGSDDQGKRKSTYQPAEVIETILLNDAQAQENTPVASDGSQIEGDLNSSLNSNDSTINLPILNGLYNLTPEVDSNYLIETDPAFTNQKNWLSSDYMVKQLKVDPNNIQKRLGDGYYEQKLIREQIINQTGMRYLDGYSNDEAQYQALMNAGVEFASRYQLTIGVALTAEQMSALTTDIVWLVSKTVVLNDGTTQQVLVPQLYFASKVSVDGSGGLVSANNVNINVNHDFSNSGKVLAGKTLEVTAGTINNQHAGLLSANNLTLNAVTDINNLGGTIIAEDLLKLTAGQNINLISTTTQGKNTVNNNHFSHTNIDSTSTLITQNDKGKMVLQAGNDINTAGAKLVSSGKNSSLVLSADNSINLSTQDIESAQRVEFDSDNYFSHKEQTEVGTSIVGNGTVELKANNNVAIHGSDVSASDKLAISAGNNVAISDSKQQIDYTSHSKIKGHSGGGTKQTVTRQTDINNTLSNGSHLDGRDVDIRVGKNLDIVGSQVVGKDEVTLTAGESVTISAGQESYYNHDINKTEKSGFMSSGGIGFTYGKEKESTTTTDTQQGYQSSTVGSTEGNVTIKAGQDLTVKGSDIIAKKEINLTGNNVTLEENDAKITYKEEYEYEKSGLTLAMTGTAADVYEAGKAVEQAKKKDNDKLLALQSIKAGLTAIQAIEDSQLKNDKGESQASIGVSVSVGTQKTERIENREEHSVMGSGVSAGDNITITATGNEQNKGGDITVKGSEVKAGQDISLEAGHDVNLIGAVNTQHSDKDEKSYGGSFGLGLTFGSKETGLKFSGNANFSRERENADGSAWSEGVVDAGKNLTVKTGNDTNLIGGQLKGDSVKLDVGNNLNIESLQDTDNYDYDKLSTSISGSYTYGSNNVDVNVSISKTEMESNWASVTDQSGVFAGKGGFDVTVGNNTDLKGAVIASTADDKSKNKLDTGTISFENIENKADFDVSHVSVSVGTSGTSPTGGIPTIYNNSGSASSTTKSAVEEGSLVVRNQDEQTQNVDELSRNTDNANNPLGQIFDKQKEQDRMDTLDLVKDIAAQAKDVVNKYDRIQAQNDLAKDKDGIINNAKDTYDKLSDSDKKALAEQGINSADDYANNSYYVAVNDKVIDNKKNNLGGMGSTVSKGIDAATAIISGLVTGDITGGLAGASAPYLAGVIKEQTYERDEKGNIRYDENGNEKVNTEANLIAHAILGAAVAAAQGNSALAGGIGAASGEVAAEFIRDKLYGKNVKDLTEQEKENISALAQLASGLAVAAGSGGNISDAGTAVAGSKNAVENNNLAVIVIQVMKPSQTIAAPVAITLQDYLGLTLSQTEVAFVLNSMTTEERISLQARLSDGGGSTQEYIDTLRDKYANLAQSSDSSSNDKSDSQTSAGAQTGSVGGASGLPPDDDKDQKSKSDSKKKETSDIDAVDFFENSSYTDKVRKQSSQNDNHGFPESVDGFAEKGKVTQFKGGDGKSYWKLEINGNYKGKEGVFEYIKGADGKINHRLFVPNK
ncbi:hemagglutinin repeat-containing protein [Orbus sturtevantii]|uniref:two-partner secretion domain-containing protein n=1 Tax=Orbus sturtevantii TaxID=3074109 RepID=UPI00370D6DF4